MASCGIPEKQVPSVSLANEALKDEANVRPLDVNSMGVHGLVPQKSASKFQGRVSERLRVLESDMCNFSCQSGR